MVHSLADDSSRFSHSRPYKSTFTSLEAFLCYNVKGCITIGRWCVATAKLINKNVLLCNSLVASFFLLIFVIHTESRSRVSADVSIVRAWFLNSLIAILYYHYIMGSEKRKAGAKTTEDLTSESSSGKKVKRKRKNPGKSAGHLVIVNQPLEENANFRKKPKIIVESQPEDDSDVTLNFTKWNQPVMNYLNRRANGGHINFKVEWLKKTVILNQISKYKTFDILGPFEKRITAIAWHPVYSQFAVSGSNRGELSLYNINRSTSEISPSINIKGSVLGLKFSSNDPSVVFVASVSGGLRQQDFSGQTTTIFTKVKWGWFNSLDVSYRKTLILAGDSSGRGHLLTTQGFKIWRSKDYMHHGSITHVEFNTRDENVFATASDDKFVKLWDMRMVANIGTKLKPVHVFPHLEPVNSACFSPSNGLSLLTTDQHSQLHIYSGPCWQEHLIIQHPHRQYEHLTPVKAAWHPIEDIIIVGRYPDENFLSADRRTIDFYDGNSGELLYRKNSPTENIISLNAFNITGECLALGSSYNVVFMKDENTLKGSSAVHKQDSQLLATKKYTGT